MRDNGSLRVDCLKQWTFCMHSRIVVFACKGSNHKFLVHLFHSILAKPQQPNNVPGSGHICRPAMNSEAGRPNPNNMMQIEMNNSCLRHGCNCHCVQCMLYIEPNAEEHSVGGLGKVLSLAT